MKYRPRKKWKELYMLLEESIEDKRKLSYLSKDHIQMLDWCLQSARAIREA